MINAGFPPIKLKTNINIASTSKERSFAKPINSNLNIRNFLTNNSKKFIDNNKKTNDSLEVLESL